MIETIWSTFQIGLAVGDIESVLKNAKLKRIAMQVQLHTELERKIPQKLIEFVDRTEHTVYPNQFRLLTSRVKYCDVTLKK